MIIRWELSRAIPPLLATAFLVCCARAPEEAITALPPQSAVPRAEVAMPKGAYWGMKVPLLLADGHYATPNQNLSVAGAVWHLRAALNVAALACRGDDEASIIAGYNALLTRNKVELASAQVAYASEYKAGGGDWQDRYDDDMTRLYNFFSQSPVRSQFCQTAATTLAASAEIEAAALPTFAAGHLAALEKPFTDFYAAYDAWLLSHAGSLEPEASPASSRTVSLHASLPLTLAAPASTVTQPVPPPKPYLHAPIDLDTRVTIKGVSAS